MEKLLVLEQLEQAERHLLEAHVRVDQQREIVAWLAREHRDTTLARDLLARFEELLKVHEQDAKRVSSVLTQLAREPAH